MIRICPYWARFFQRGDGWFLAHCSARAYTRYQEEHPHWQDEFPREERCILGFSRREATLFPSLIIGNFETGEWTLYRSAMENREEYHIYLTDEMWSALVTHFLSWENDRHIMFFNTITM